jgi:hypothetical protein
MKRILLIGYVLFQTTIVSAQIDTTASNSTASLKTAAGKMAGLFLQKNYTAYINYVHPKIVSMLGGKQKMIGYLKNTMAEMKRSGFTFDDMQIGEPSPIITTKTEWQSVVPQTIQLGTAQGKLVTTGYLIAVSSNRGKTWYFIDTSNKTLDDLKKTFPGLSSQIVIPEKEQPKLSNE